MRIDHHFTCGVIDMRWATLSVAFLSCLIGAATGDAAEGPSTRPSIPPLVVGSERSPSFVVNGVWHVAGDFWLGFHFATDGTRQACAITDAGDGTPIYLSDGRQTLVYDLMDSRLMLIPNSRAYVTVDWKAKDERPLDFAAGVQSVKDPTKLDQWNSWFRLDRFVEAAAGSLRPIGADEKGRLYAAERAGRSIETIQQADRDRSWFRFMSRRPGEDFDAGQLEARHIAQPLPRGAIAFPDLASLRRDVAVADVDPALVPSVTAYLKNGIALMAKLGIKGGDDVRPGADGVLLHPDWEQLRARDREFGTRYRAALDRQGIRFTKDMPATRPSR